ncbi:MAG TPA: hypothetical protein VFN35_15570, partial [Ktedonobacteraceae bacterium]|nr:hypothetical protein [Ktedonobacteraceae bacterium]
MQLRTFTHVADFLEHVQCWLERYEIMNSLPLRICLDLKRFFERIVLAPYLAVVEEDDTPIITAIIAPWASLLLSYSLDPREEVLELIAHDLYEQGWQVSGV